MHMADIVVINNGKIKKKKVTWHNGMEVDKEKELLQRGKNGGHLD